MLKRITTVLMVLLTFTFLFHAEAAEKTVGVGKNNVHIGLGLKQLHFKGGYDADTYGAVLGWNNKLMPSDSVDFNAHFDFGYFAGTDSNDLVGNIWNDDIHGAMGLSIGNPTGPFKVKVGAALTFDYITTNYRHSKTITSGGVKGFGELLYAFPTGGTESFAGFKYEYNTMFGDQLNDTQTYMLMLGTSF